MATRMVNEAELTAELIEQIASYIDICAMYEVDPTVRGYADHLSESYS